MIRFSDVTVTYAGAARPAISNVNLHIPEGELALIVGPTGSGKTTLLKAINGLVPHFTGGELRGRVTVAGRDTKTNPPRELADVVGIVQQDPMSGFVTDTVEDELAYGLETIGLDPQTMRRRVEETLDLLGLAELRSRPLLSLSGGQRQRVAIGSVLTMHPKVLVLDEPTSALDPGAAEDVLAALQRLVHDLGVTVLIAEHRLERVVQFADRIVVVHPGGSVTDGSPAMMMRTAPVAPPVVELGRLAGWDPLPLSIRDARRRAAGLRERLTSSPAMGELPLRRSTVPPPSPAIAVADSVAARYGHVTALRNVDLAVHPREVVALMGRNGAGKSTLLSSLVGLRKPDSGTVRVGGLNPADLVGHALITRVGLVPQEPGDLLYADSVAAECRQADTDARVPAGTTAALLTELAPGIRPETHPRDLSEGQRLCLVLALILACDPPLLLLDEPTRGLDYAAKRRLVGIIRTLAGQGRAIVMATHDVELVAEVATRVAILAEGELVADGPTDAVVTSSPLFAPQVSKILSPGPWLTVPDVEAALAEAG